jgi:ABC-type antimicrobial peptide transport system permease subunit
MAKKYFGSSDPMGKTLLLDNNLNFIVTGILKKIPSNSHLQFDMAVHFDIVEKLGWAIRVWDFSIASTYILLDQNMDSRAFEKKIKGLIKNYDEETNIELSLQPLTKIHLYSNFSDSGGQGRIQYVYVFFLVGILILIMACINFMNLTTARSENRAKEIGMRKVIGAKRKIVIWQFLTESVLYAFTALIFVPLLLSIFLPEFSEITQQSFAFSDFLQIKPIFLVLGLTLFTGLLAGSYPALFLSSFVPVNVLRGGQNPGKRGAGFRKILVFTQVCVSLILIIVAGVIYRQVNYLKNKELGYDKQNIVTIPLGISNRNNTQIYQRIKNELKNDPHIEQVTASFTHPTWFASPTDKVVFKGRRLDENIPVAITSVDYDFIETLKINIKEGRSFSEEYGSERGNLIVNEQFEKLMGVDSALNQTLSIGEDYQGKIIGVMKDFHIDSISDAKIAPLILFQNPGVNFIYIRTRPGQTPSSQAAIKSAWEKAAEDLPFKFNYLDEEIRQLYLNVETLSSIIKYFTLMAVFIACLGLLGLMSFSAEKRTKEIGVRKVLGAKVGEIVFLLSKDFLKLTLLANLIAWPVSWWLMHNWLKNFAYSVSLSIWTFVLSGILALGIAFFTVGFQAVKASLADPVNSLRYE